MAEPLHDAARLAAEIAELDARRIVREVRFEVDDPRFRTIFPEGSAVTQIAGGFVNTEGPVWMDGRLLFVDPARNRIVAWRGLPEGPEVTTYRYPSGQPLDRPATVGQCGAMGLTLDNDGLLLACETGTRRVTRIEADGRITVIADRFEGRRLNRPNDVVVGRDGAVYFTDPVYRLPTPDEPVEQPPGVYRVMPGEAPTRLAEDIGFPNGLALSPDERVLYVADSNDHSIRALALDAQGRTIGNRPFASMRSPLPGVPDGVKVDRKGHVYCGGGGGLWVFDPAGIALGRVVFPDWPRNMAWGDAGWRTLYVTAGTAVYRLPTAAAGLPVGPEARVSG